MVALYIILGLLALIFILLLCRVYVRVSYCQTLLLEIRYLFIKKRIDVAISEKQPQHAVQTAEKRKEKPKKEKEKPQYKTPPLDVLVPAAYEELKKTLKKLGKSARLDHARLRCCVASDDPAETAIIYGAVSGAAGNMFVLLKSLKRRKKSRGTIDFRVEPDFIADEPDIDIDIKISVVPLKLIFAAVAGYKGFRKIRSLFIKQAEKEDNNDKGELK